MALTNYSELLSAVAEWEDRAVSSDYYARIPDFIRLTELLVEKGDPSLGIQPLRTRDMEEDATSTPNASAEVALPSDYLSIRRVTQATNPVSTLDPVTPEWARDVYASKPSGWPQFYSIEGPNLTVWPTNTSDVTIYYYEEIPDLTVSNTTNWLMTKAPEIYLFGCLYQGAVYLKDAEKEASFLRKFAGAVTGLQQADDGGRYKQSRMRRRGCNP